MTEAQEIARKCADRARQLHAAGHLDAARAELTQGLKQVPDDIGLLQILADVLDASNRINEAIAVCDRLGLLCPADATLRAKAGQMWERSGDFIRAEKVYQAALTIDPSNDPAAQGLINMWGRAGQIAETKSLLRRRAKIARSPEARAAHFFNAAFAQPVVATSTKQIEDTRQELTAAVSAKPTSRFQDPYKLGLSPNFYLGYQARNDRSLQEALASYYLAATPSLAEAAPHVGSRANPAKIKVGIVSRYFAKHTVGYLSYGLVSLLDRQRFEVTLFRTPHGPRDGGTPRFLEAAPLIDLPPDLTLARREIANAKLDVLHFPEIGMDGLAYFLAFARLATLQTVAWGHPITTGIPNIDLFLSCDAMEPINGESHYSERLMRLKTLTFCGEPPPAAESFELQVDSTRPSYLCSQSLYKVHPDFDATLAALLRQDRKGIIYFVTFMPYTDALLKARLAERMGADIERVRFLPRMTTRQFLHLSGNVDVILDAPQWAGGKTSLEAFAMGTPIVHWPGEFMRGRHTLAFYRRMRIEAPVVDSSEAYVATAVRLVHDSGFRADVRAQIVANSAKLFNDVASIREIEEVWETALRERC